MSLGTVGPSVKFSDSDSDTEGTPLPRQQPARVFMALNTRHKGWTVAAVAGCLNVLAVEPEKCVKDSISTCFNSHSRPVMCVHQGAGVQSRLRRHCCLVTVGPKEKGLFDVNPEKKFIC